MNMMLAAQTIPFLFRWDYLFRVSKSSKKGIFLQTKSFLIEETKS